MYRTSNTSWLPLHRAEHSNLVLAVTCLPIRIKNLVHQDTFNHQCIMTIPISLLCCMEQGCCPLSLEKMLILDLFWRMSPLSL